ncbi:hypothetical protein DPMN_038190 [Dreissena polymorpha]|uniref:Uncharacterized protein n=1 Tax=Dreissena polymorpha TaxID=45954 RepID=A0A9D4RPY5_DREPO|nr:hypothetical protein DPMN_038190 [Dreissena polymorpha]
MLHSFGIVCLICAFAQMVIGETSNTFKAAVYEHAVHLPNVSIVPMQRDQAVEAMMVNIRVYQETATLAASMGYSGISAVFRYFDKSCHGNKLKTTNLSRFERGHNRCKEFDDCNC